VGCNCLSSLVVEIVYFVTGRTLGVSGSWGSCRMAGIPSDRGGGVRVDFPLCDTVDFAVYTTIPWKNLAVAVVRGRRGAVERRTVFVSGGYPYKCVSRLAARQPVGCPGGRSSLWATPTLSPSTWGGRSALPLRCDIRYDPRCRRPSWHWLRCQLGQLVAHRTGACFF